jgi:YebC/PmpR family DNA-binding regulatory protein
VAGHSKWANIKHKKGAADKRRGQLFTRLARAITVAAREGGPDMDGNFNLRLAADKARAANMPKENIERAIQRGVGGAKGDDLVRIVYEGYGPHSTAVMIAATTDNRNRTAGEVRNVFTRHGCSLGESGSVAWQFAQRGVITVEGGAIDPDEVALLAIEAGASDFEAADGAVVIYTDVPDFHRVREALAASGLEAADAEIAMVPTNEVELDAKKTLQVMRFLESLEDLDDVDNVWSNVSISDEAAAEFEAA